MAAALDAEFNLDFTGTLFDGIVLVETLGLKVRTFDRDFPAVVEHLIKNQRALSGLKVPDPHTAGRMPRNLQALNGIATQSEKPLLINVPGPFTLAGHLAGVEDFARILIQDPGFAHDLLAFTTETVRAYTHAVSRAGADLVCIGEPTAVILSPKQFGRYVVPNVRKVFEGLDAWTAVHICGDTSHLLHQMLSIGAEGLSLDQVMDIPALMPLVPGETVIFGNIDPIYTMLDMTPEGVRRESEDLLEAVRAYPNFVMSTGCDCPLETPFENIHSLIETTHAHPQAKEHAPVDAPQAEAGKARAPAPRRRDRQGTAPADPLPDEISNIRRAVAEYDKAGCVRNCREACSRGISINDAIQKGLSGGMEEAGIRFSEGLYFIPELILCADALYAGLDILIPLLLKDDLSGHGRLMIGVIQGDIHEIGKNLVVAMFRAAGWEVLDLGSDVPSERFVEEYASFRPDIVGISALMHASTLLIPETVSALKARFPEARIMVGGAPLTPETARKLGADGYAENAALAVMEGARMLESEPQQI